MYISVKRTLLRYFFKNYGECLSWAIGLSFNQLLSALPHCGPINFIMCLFLCRYISCCDPWYEEFVSIFLGNKKNFTICLSRWFHIQDRMSKWKNVHAATMSYKQHLEPHIIVALNYMYSACLLFVGRIYINLYLSYKAE